ncbi:hypothetical protein ACETU7_21930 [Rhodococcus sp. 3Y1]
MSLCTAQAPSLPRRPPHGHSHDYTEEGRRQDVTQGAAPAGRAVDATACIGSVAAGVA